MMELLCSSKSLDKEDSNRGIAFYFDDDALMVEIDWTFSKIPVNAGETQARAIVSLEWLYQNLKLRKEVAEKEKTHEG